MTDDFVHPLRTSRLSLSLQAQHYLLSLIKDGSYQPGDQLPSESDLAARLGISRPTLREALLNLEQDGVLIRKHGVGTFVAPGYGSRLESGLERLESILELAAREGMQVEVEDLQVQEGPADKELAERLQVPVGAPLICVRRVIVVDRSPVAYLFDVAPASILCPTDLEPAGAGTCETFNGSVLELLRRKPDLQITQAIANIVAINADPVLAGKLGVRTQQALLLLEETLHDGNGAPVEYSRNYFVPEFFRFRVVRR